MDYEELSYEECFNQIFNEININKKSINKLNDIVINQKKEIEELKNEIEDLKKSNEKENLKINNKLNDIVINQKKEIEELKNEKENLMINNKLNSCRIENFVVKTRNEIIDILNVKTKEIKEEIKNIQENEIEYIYDNIANLNIEVKENIKINNKLKNIIEIDIKKETEELKNEVEDFKKSNEKERKELEEYQNANELDIDCIDKRVTKIEKDIKNININNNEIYENIANLNIEVKENIKINSKTNNEIIELKEIKNNLHFSHLICSYNYHISYLKDIVKLEIDLFAKLINNNILPINFITPQGPNNIQCAVKYGIENCTNKYLIYKYLQDDDKCDYIMDNKYNFNLTDYICINNIKIKDLGKFNPYRKNNINNYKYDNLFFQAPEIKIQHNLISKNTFYKSLYNNDDELIIENNDFFKMIEMKEDIEEMEEIILDCLARYEFMKTLKRNTIYL